MIIFFFFFFLANEINCKWYQNPCYDSASGDKVHIFLLANELYLLVTLFPKERKEKKRKEKKTQKQKTAANFFLSIIKDIKVTSPLASIVSLASLHVTCRIQIIN